MVDLGCVACDVAVEVELLHFLVCMSSVEQNTNCKEEYDI
jgi:hypothetical protein